MYYKVNTTNIRKGKPGDFKMKKKTQSNTSENSKNDKELLPCISENDCDAFVLKYMGFVYSIVNKFKPEVKNHEVDELVNDIFVQLLKNNREKLKKFDPDKGLSLMSWINLIASRTIINVLKRKERKIIFVNNDHIKDSEKLTDMVQTILPKENYLIAHIEKMIEKLPKRHRLFFELFYDKNKNLDEIANILQIKMEGVYSLKYKAIKSLKKKLTKCKGGQPCLKNV